MMPDCATSLEDDSLLDSLPAERLSSKASSQFRCGEAEVPYCANNETLVICTPNKAFVGVVNCSAQHLARKSEPLQCDRSTNRCTISSVWELPQHAASDTEELQRSTKSYSQSMEPLTVSQSPLGTETALPNISFMFPDSYAKNRRTQGTTPNIQLQITIPDTSNEGDYNNELYDGDEEYEVYDLEGSLPNYADIKCEQKGLQCADKKTIMDCSENFTQPSFILSCASLLHSDDGENAVGHCDNDTRSCILTSQSMSLSLNINTVINDNFKVCETYTGLRCVDNETLVACSGDANSTYYRVSCKGEAMSDTGSFIQGHCYENSCMFVIAHQTNNSDMHADGSENTVSDYLPTPDTNSAISQPLYSHTNITDAEDNHAEPDILIQQVKVFDLYDEYKALKHNLSKAEEEYFIDDDEDTEMHTTNSAPTRDNYLITDNAGNILHITQDDSQHTDDDLTSTEGTQSVTGEPYLHLELVSSHNDNSSEVTNPVNTEIYSRTSPMLSLNQIPASVSQTRLSTSVATLIETTSHTAKSILTETVPFVNKIISTETTIPTSKSVPRETISSIPENITETISSVFETITETIFSVPETITETIYSVPETITETVSSVIESIEETISSVFETITETISIIPETILPTGTTAAVSKFIFTETTSTKPETTYTETTTFVSKTIPKGTASPILEITSTETINHFSDFIPTVTSSSSPETASTEITMSVSETFHRETAYPVPETVYTETTTPVSKLIHRETASPVPETIYTETMTPVSKLIHKETVFSVHEIAPTETMSVSETFHGETASPIPEATYTGTMTPVSKLVHGETAFSVPETASTETMSVSQTFHAETASPVPETIYTDTMDLNSKFIHRETDFPVPIETTISISETFNGETASPVPETIYTETMTPVSKFIHKETTSPVPETIHTEIMNPVSNLIHMETDFSIHETVTTKTTKSISDGETAYPVPVTVHTETTEATKTTTPVSKIISRTTAAPVPEIIYAETTNLNPGTTIPASHTTGLVSDPPFTDVIIPVSKQIPALNIQEADNGSTTELHFNLQTPGTNTTVELLSEALIPQPTVDKSGFKSTTILPTAETEEPEHLVSVSSPTMNEVSEVSNTHQKHVCRKAGIQCMDSLTLAACLPDLTLSYTISCRALLPYMTSEHHVIYCDHRLDTCALAPLKDSFN
ncbi:hypothetical protein B7P43_G04374 [Cryptotermes secundus]|uniref:Uncharacterized protein n=2 Tax=Cryptotermes secundus TaxID=105785 RepID=A0A2J7QC82_9NEOP|nr:hypothetical protein B7P43_G04374 [Cryptotermes secundus]